MKRFQKALFTLAAVVALGWIGASTASAQVTFFVSPSSARPVRAEGQTEAVGTVAFAANSGGTIIGAVPPAIGSQLILNYGTTVLSVGDSTPATPVPLACSGTIGMTLGGVAQTPAQIALILLKTCTGNAVALTFIANQALAPGDSITLSGVRVNANALGAGANVNVLASGQVPAAVQATNPITLVVFTALTVATVQAAPSTTVKLTPIAGQNILFCAVTTATVSTLLVDITEKFSEAFLTGGTVANGGTLVDPSQERGLGLEGDGGIPASFKMRFLFTNVPVGVRITTIIPAQLISPSIALGAAPAAVTSTVAIEQEIELDVVITATNTALVETAQFQFDFSVPDISDTAFPKVEGSANLRITLRGTSDPPDAPIFSTASASRQFDGPAFRTLACASYLLFPWVAYTGDGAVDTGLAIANTTKDPPQIGTISQKGDVTLHFWRATGTSNPAPVKIATALEGGNTATYVVSQLGSPFSGYVIAVCGFQMGHGIAAFLSGGSFNAFTALSLTNPRIGGAVGVTELAGH